MPKYQVAIHHPDNCDAAVSEDGAMNYEIGTLNDEMKTAGVRVFVGGLHPASSAKLLRAQPDAAVLMAAGPCLKTTERVDGFGVPVEVRPFC